MKKKFFALMLAALGAVASAQNPQSQTAPTFAVNAKYTNGVAPGYAPTAGAGLVLNVGPGTANCSGTIVTYAGGTLTMTASVTNYVYLNTSASCAPAVKTTAFTSTDIPVAIVVTGSSLISSISDDRTPFNAAISGTLTLQTNGVNNASQTLLNIQSGSGVTVTNTSGGNVQVSATGGGSEAECFLGIGGLVGAFTDSAGVIKQALCIGNGPVSLTVPAGATQLQLGVVDDDYQGSPNTGSFTVSVSKNGAAASNFTVAGTAGPWSTSTNPSYPYSINDFTAPTVVTGFVAGDTATVAYVSGLVNVDAPAAPCNVGYDANGCLVSPPGSAGHGGPTDSILSPSSTWWPTKYMSDTYSSGAITALTGDGTATGPGSVPLTLATVNSTPGTCGDATHVCQTTTNGKGLVTNQAAVAISATNITLQTNGTNNTSQSLLNLTAAGPIQASNTSGGNVQISCPTCSVGTGTSVTVNGGSSLGTANFNGTTPAAPTGNTNITFQQSGSNVSAYVPTGTINTSDIFSSSRSSGTAWWHLQNPPEYYSAVNGTPITLVSQTGAGMISSLWVASNSQQSLHQSTINITINGEGSPYLSGPVSSVMWCWYIGQASSSTQNGSAVSGATSGGSCMLRLPIPYSSGITVTLTPSASYTLWAQANGNNAGNTWAYTKKMWMQFYCAGVGTALCNTSPASIPAAYSQMRWANFVSATAGRLVGIAYLMDGAVGTITPAYAPMEGNVRVFVDTATAVWAASTSMPASTTIMDSYGNQQTSAGGTTAAGSEPAFTHCWTGGTQTDGTVTWTTTVGEPSNIWRASKPYSLTCQMSIWDTNGNVETVTTAGTSGASAPTWPAAGCGGTGVTTTDGTVTWTCSPGTSVIKAAIVSTGGEDFPFNSFYGSSQSPLGSMGSGEAGVLDINSSTLGLYRLFIHEPIYFNQSLAVYEENGDSSEITFTGNATWAANVIFANNDTN